MSTSSIALLARVPRLFVADAAWPCDEADRRKLGGGRVADARDRSASEGSCWLAA